MDDDPKHEELLDEIRLCHEILVRVEAVLLRTEPLLKLAESWTQKKTAWFGGRK